MIHKNIERLIGNTPLIQINRLHRHPDITICGKMEGYNPGGSVKDRPALSMFAEGEKSGLLKPGTKLIEPTSGNTGIALAMIAAIKSFSIELAMPENSSVERIRTMKAYGAKITLTPKSKSMEGAIDYARQKLKTPNYVMLNQFANQANPLAHYRTTGPEIWSDTNGAITHFVSAMGTTGTIMGTSRYLKEKNPAIQIIGVQPKDGSQITGIRRWFGDYIPKIYDRNRIDHIIDVDKNDAVLTTRNLAKKEGIFCGVSSGGAMWATLELAKTLTKPAVIVTVICDCGDRYVSTDLFQ